MIISDDDSWRLYRMRNSLGDRGSFQSQALIRYLSAKAQYHVAVLFKEHDANNQQISAIFTDKNYQEIKSCAVLESGNGHTFETIVVGDILTDIL